MHDEFGDPEPLPGTGHVPQPGEPARPGLQASLEAILLVADEPVT